LDIEQLILTHGPRHDILNNLITESGTFVWESGGNWEFVFVDGGNWEFVFMDWGNWELVNVDGSDGQVVTLGLESSIISDPGQSEFLAFRRNPVGRSLVGVSVDFLGVFFAVVIDGGDGEFLLDLGLVAGGVVRQSVAIITHTT
jgi:hypothetical protein